VDFLLVIDMDCVQIIIIFENLMVLGLQGYEQVDLNKLNVNQCLVEAVIAAGSPMVKKRVAELQFRTRYKAAIVAVHRHARVIDW